MDEADPWYSEKKLFSSGVVSPEEPLFKAFASRNDPTAVCEPKEHSQPSREAICALVKVL